jgi:hypothetical protein
LPITKFVNQHFVHRQDFEFALTASFVCDITLLKHSPPVVIYKAGDTIKSELIGFHSTPRHPFGLTFDFCGTNFCSRPGEVTSHPVGKNAKGHKIFQKCLRCPWRSVNVDASDLQFVAQWSSAHPNVYRSTFPLTPREEMSIVLITSVRNLQSEVAAKAMGNRKRKRANSVEREGERGGTDGHGVDE